MAIDNEAVKDIVDDVKAQADAHLAGGAAGFADILWGIAAKIEKAFAAQAGEVLAATEDPAPK